MTPANGPAVVIDTMVVSAIINATRQPELASSYRALIDARPIVVSFVTITEMRYGARKAGWGQLRRQGLERDLAQLVVIQPDDDLMRMCAHLRADLEAAGHPLGQKAHEADRWIAATAIELAVDLVSDDAIFDNVPGLIALQRPA